MKTLDREAPLCLPRRPLDAPAAQRAAAGTIDTHFHVFRAGAPLNRRAATRPTLRRLPTGRLLPPALNIARGVLVQPSVYGSRQPRPARGPGRLSGPPARASSFSTLEQRRDEIARLDRLGVRGVRINTRNKGGLPLTAAIARTLAPTSAGRCSCRSARSRYPSLPDALPRLGMPLRR